MENNFSELLELMDRQYDCSAKLGYSLKVSCETEKEEVNLRQQDLDFKQGSDCVENHFKRQDKNQKNRDSVGSNLEISGMNEN